MMASAILPVVGLWLRSYGFFCPTDFSDLFAGSVAFRCWRCARLAHRPVTFEEFTAFGAKRRDLELPVAPPADICGGCWDGLPLLLLPWDASDHIAAPARPECPRELTDPRRVIIAKDTNFIWRPRRKWRRVRLVEWRTGGNFEVSQREGTERGWTDI